MIKCNHNNLNSEKRVVQTDYFLWKSTVISK